MSAFCFEFSFLCTCQLFGKKKSIHMCISMNRIICGCFVMGRYLMTFVEDNSINKICESKCFHLYRVAQITVKFKCKNYSNSQMFLLIRIIISLEKQQSYWNLHTHLSCIPTVYSALTSPLNTDIPVWVKINTAVSQNDMLCFFKYTFLFKSKNIEIVITFKIYLKLIF